MKVIFLDIDGVMNTQKHAIELLELHRKGLCTDEDLHNWDLPYKDTLNALSYIISKTQAKIVLSSTWRIMPTKVKQLNECFEPYGFQIYDKICNRVDLIDLERIGLNCTPHSVYKYKNKEKYTTDRGAEIALWLYEHPEVERFVILDDDIVDIAPYYTKEHIQTDFYEDGLDFFCANKAIKILNNKD